MSFISLFNVDRVLDCRKKGLSFGFVDFWLIRETSGELKDTPRLKLREGCFGGTLTSVVVVQALPKIFRLVSKYERWLPRYDQQKYVTVGC